MNEQKELEELKSSLLALVLPPGYSWGWASGFSKSIHGIWGNPFVQKTLEKMWEVQNWKSLIHWQVWEQESQSERCVLDEKDGIGLGDEN